MVSTIPAYLLLADGGFAGAARRKMSMLAGAEDKTGVRRVFQSAWMLLLFVSLALIALVPAAVYSVNLSELLSFKEIGNDSFRIVAVFLLLYVLVGFQIGLLTANFWIVSRYPTALFLTGLTALIEFLLLLFIVLNGGGYVAAAAAMLIGRCFGFLCLLTVLLLHGIRPRYGIRYAEIAEIRRLFKPSVSSMAFPLGNALNVQGTRIVVGLVLGPPILALVAAVTTLSRLISKVRVAVNQVLLPELSRIYGSTDAALFRRLLLRASQVVLWMSLFAALLILFAGEAIFHVWTNAQLDLDAPLFYLLLIASVINATWFTSLAPLIATNQHMTAAAYYVTIYGFGSLGLTYILATTIGISGVGWSAVLTELIAGSVILTLSLRFSGLNLVTWARSVGQPPFFLVSEVRRFLHVRPAGVR
ncbi:hypothetical protein [uncultured Thiohalocapsa sp.]|uniref:lipopolysaccharide biosynthesis protein n=1 Tax=uncultured Thiohalocapsa sp. TaxID=768990 RepID=UPI0025F262BD|nr:hypothetical protein [uncultured Thiohalocapsa sp.]